MQPGPQPQPAGASTGSSSRAGAQQTSPRSAARPSRTATAAKPSAATGSAHHQPSAPFHLPKNSVADALLMELYRTALDRLGPEEPLCFVTANYEDFSAWKADRRLPHADFADLFDERRSRYVYGVDGLRAILATEFGEEFEELEQEVHLVHEEPRTFSEILDAEQEYFDKVWYVRHLIRLEKESDGQAGAPSPEIQARASAAARAIEERYGPENIGPWDDWGWGFVNGKLSALRWVLGSEWDFLDT